MDAIYYLWIGPEPNPLICKGMDTVGPVLSRKRFPSTTIYFYCLDEYCDHYKERLEPLGIHVHGILDFLKQKEIEPQSETALHKSELASLQDFITRLIYNAKSVHRMPVNSIREYVTVKALMQYLLPIYYSGYFLDTNVIPLDDSSTSLPSFSEPKAPFLQWYFDPWLVYSPEDDVNATERFLDYFTEVLHELNERTAVELIDRERLGAAFVHPFSIYQSSEKHKFRMDTQGFGPRRIPESGFYKRYSNTHKRDIQTNIIDTILSYADVPLHELEYYLSSYQGQLYASIENKNMFFCFFFSELQHLSILIPFICTDHELYVETIRYSLLTEMKFTQTVQLLCTLKARGVQHGYFFRAYQPRSPDLSSLKEHDLPTLQLACLTVLANGPLHAKNINWYVDTMKQIGFIKGLSEGDIVVRENLRRCLRQSIGLQNTNAVQGRQLKTYSFLSRMEACHAKRKEGFFKRHSSYRDKRVEDNRQEETARNTCTLF